MIRRRALLRALPALLPAATAAAVVVDADAGFEFVALGDMPYGPDLIAGQAYRHLIGLVNQQAPPFTLHVGDFKDGYSPCTDDEYALQQQHFQRFDAALVYTPGDNDWIDCQRRGDDPLLRLQALRQRFFAAPHSQGARPISVQRQADAMPAFAPYVENLRWAHAGVLFASVHTVGPNNGFDDPHPAVRAEALAREVANAAWIADSFALASRQGARALVLATQADVLGPAGAARPREGTPRDGFARSVGRSLLPLAEAAPFPVLLVHGDSHRFITDRPFRNARGQPITNLWRLQVFGEPQVHAVRVRVQTGPASRGADAAPFSFTPIWNPLSTDPRLLRRGGTAG